MGSDRQESFSFSAPADEVFGAVLGVMQHAKKISILAVHTPGRRLIAREKSMFSNAKVIEFLVTDADGATQLHVGVITDPRAPKALLDGKVNEKALRSYVEEVRGALDGSAPAPATPVPDHFVQKKDQVPWVDPEQDPAIEVGGNLLAAYGL